MNDFNPSPEPGAQKDQPSIDDSQSRLSRFEVSADAVHNAAQDDALLADRLCRLLVDVLAVDGAAISVYLGADLAVPVGASDLSATIGEALQFTLREGPCFESYRSAAAILMPDITDPQSPAWSNWPRYSAQLLRRTPYQGVFAYPLMSGATALGSISLYCRSLGQPGGLGDADAIASVVAGRLLRAQAFFGGGQKPVHSWLDSPGGVRRQQVWLAQGLVLQANRITPGQALDLLRAMAFSDDRLLDQIADDMVAGRIPVPVLND